MGDAPLEDEISDATRPRLASQGLMRLVLEVVEFSPVLTAFQGYFVPLEFRDWDLL